MTINVEISPSIHRELEAMAAEIGQPVEVYVHDLIENSVRTKVPIETILAPFQRGFSESGMTEEEATELIDAGIDAVRAEARAIHR